MTGLAKFENRPGKDLLRLAEKVKMLRADYEDDTLYSPIGALSGDTILRDIRDLIKSKTDKKAIADKLLTLGAGCVSKLDAKHYCEFISFLIDID